MYFLCAVKSLKIKIMSRKKIDFSDLKMTIEIVDVAGEIVSFSDYCKVARSTFAKLVNDCVSRYCYGIREIRLLDSAGRVFKSYKQHF